MKVQFSGVGSELDGRRGLLNGGHDDGIMRSIVARKLIQVLGDDGILRVERVSLGRIGTRGRIVAEEPGLACFLNKLCEQMLFGDDEGSGVVAVFRIELRSALEIFDRGAEVVFFEGLCAFKKCPGGCCRIALYSGLLRIAAYAGQRKRGKRYPVMAAAANHRALASRSARVVTQTSGWWTRRSSKL